MSKKILLLLESPSKCAKVQSFVGDNYIVASTKGHIREIPKQILGINCNNNYEITFKDMKDKKDVIDNIKKLAKNAKYIIGAQDNDREGHSIYYHVTEILNIKPENQYRALFSEITKDVIVKAVNNLTLLDHNCVKSQFCRLVIDKIIGYKLSPLLWSEFNSFTLAAGRVMSPVVRLIFDRENEIAKFQSQSYYKLEANFVLDKKDLSKGIKTSKISKSSNTESLNNVIQTTCDENIKDQSIIEKLYKDCSENKAKFSIKSLAKTTSTRNPSAPYITSTLQQDASTKLGMSPDICMRTAQVLYEAGLITYMRTDSTYISEDAMKSIKTCIENKWGENYYKRTIYKSKDSSAQEAHEACRVVDFSKESVLGLDSKITAHHNRLYQLIWRRTVASQMSPANIEIRTVKIITGEKKKDQLVFTGKHEKVIFEGYLAAFNLHKKKVKVNAMGDLVVNEDAMEDEMENEMDEDEEDEPDEADEDDNEKATNSQHNKYLETIYDKLKEGDLVFSQSMNCTQKYSKPKQTRYTEANLIKKLSELQIGRPSTYASIIKKIQEKQYVERKTLPPKKAKINIFKYTYPDIIKIESKETKIEGDKNKLMITSLGLMITEYLNKNFTEIMSYEYTANIEKLLDDIAEGKVVWYKVVDSIYLKLVPVIDTLSKAVSERKALKSADPKSDTSSRRMLGTNPTTTNPIVSIKSRSGYLIVEENPIKKNSRFASFSSNFEEMTLETALGLLIYPKTLSKYKDVDIIIKKAKNVYISYGNANYSIENYVKANQKQNKFDNPNNVFIDDENITFEEAKRIIDYYEKSKIDKAENAKQDKVMNDQITIKKGPYGYYIKLDGTINVKLPKKYSKDIDNITLEQCLEVVEKHKATPPKGSRASRFGTAGKQKAKEKKEMKEKKEKKATIEATETTETTEPKATKKPRVPKAKKIEPKATIVSILEPEVEQLPSEASKSIIKVRKPRQKKEKTDE
jgi:DNA topoisomerase-1